MSKKKIILWAAGVISAALMILSFLPIFKYTTTGACPGDDPMLVVAGFVRCEGNFWQSDIQLGVMPPNAKAWIIANILVSLTTVIFAIVALKKPRHLSSEASSGEKFYLKMYAIRAIPFGLLVTLAPMMMANPIVSLVLFTAATVQIGDSVLGIRWREKAMTILPMIAALFYIVLGILLARHWWDITCFY